MTTTTTISRQRGKVEDDDDDDDDNVDEDDGDYNKRRESDRKRYSPKTLFATFIGFHSLTLKSRMRDLARAIQQQQQQPRSEL